MALSCLTVLRAIGTPTKIQDFSAKADASVAVHEPGRITALCGGGYPMRTRAFIAKTEAAPGGGGGTRSRLLTVLGVGL